MILVHIFPDGTTLTADQEVHGVADLHDVVHMLLAEAAGTGTSPTLLRMAHGNDTSDPAAPDDDLVAYEEAAVLAIQAYMRALVGPTWGAPT
jgi:hypothetical protein